MSEECCKYCDFRTQSVIEIHDHILKSHSLLKSVVFDCRICPLKFYSRRAFVYHLKNHKNEIVRNNISDLNGWKCKLCSKYIENVKLRSHNIQHLKNGEQIECPLCTLKFKSQNNFSSHLRRHHTHSTTNNTIQNSNFNSESTQKSHSPINNIEIDTFNDSDINHSFSNNNIDEHKDLIDFPVVLGKLLLQLKANYGVTNRSLDFIVQEFSNISGLIFDGFDKILQQSEADNEIKTKTEMLRSRLGSFSQFDSKYKREKYFKTKFKYTEPKKIVLEGVSDAGEQKIIYYVPVAETLMTLLEDKSIFEMIELQRPIQEEVFGDYYDGMAYKNKNFFTEGERKIELLFFEDACNLNNPLGAAKAKDKMVFVYYAIGNLPPELRCKKENVQLAFAFNEDLLKQGETFQSIFQHFTKEMIDLENIGITPFGVTNMKVGMVFMCGDNLGQHQIGGFNANFSKAHFLCRVCNWTVQDKIKGDVSIKQLRNDDNFESLHSKFSFVKSQSVLLKIPHFKISTDLPPCTAHNLFSTGSFSRDLISILNQIMKNQLNSSLTITNLNNDLNQLKKSLRNISFPYITNKKITGKMHEIFMLIVYIPVILLYYNIDQKTPEYELLQSMVEITKLVTANEISKSQVCKLRTLVQNYFDIRPVALPKEPLYPKHHYLMHLPDMIMLYGPPNKYWTMYFEHKHQTFKYIAVHTHNKINIAKSMTEIHQMQQAILFEDRVLPKVLCNNAFPIDSALFSIEVPTSFKLVSKKLKYKDIFFGQNDNVLVNFKGTTLELIKIKFLILTENYKNVLIYGNKIKYKYNSHLLIYEHLLNYEGMELFDISKILFHKPINVFYIKKSNNSYCILQSTVPE